MVSEKIQSFLHLAYSFLKKLYIHPYNVELDLRNLFER